MSVFLLTIHIIVAVLLTLIILLQQGGGGGLSGMFGGGSGMDDILSSPSGDIFLRKITVTLVIIFFLTSLILAVRTSHRSAKSLLENAPVIPAPVTRQQTPINIPEKPAENP